VAFHCRFICPCLHNFYCGTFEEIEVTLCRRPRNGEVSIMHQWSSFAGNSIFFKNAGLSRKRHFPRSDYASCLSVVSLLPELKLHVHLPASAWLSVLYKFLWQKFKVSSQGKKIYSALSFLRSWIATTEKLYGINTKHTKGRTPRLISNVIKPKGHGKIPSVFSLSEYWSVIKILDNWLILKQSYSERKKNRIYRSSLH